MLQNAQAVRLSEFRRVMSPEKRRIVRRFLLWGRSTVTINTLLIPCLPLCPIVNWLLDHQNADGTWNESLATGTGFPNVFYLKYDMYRNYFPTLALAIYQKAFVNS